MLLSAGRDRLSTDPGDLMKTASRWLRSIFVLLPFLILTPVTAKESTPSAAHGLTPSGSILAFGQDDINLLTANGRYVLMDRAAELLGP